MNPARFRMELLLLGALVANGACLGAEAQVQSPSQHPARSATHGAPAATALYTRMGGTATVTAVVDEVIDRAASEPRLKRSFDGVNLAHVKKMLIEQICALSGGGCTYSGDSMRDVHAGHHIGQGEFYGLVEVLRESLRAHGVALRERNELLEILAPMKRDIVER